MTKSPEMRFKMQAHASALLAIGGRVSHVDQLKLARAALDLPSPGMGALEAVRDFLATVNTTPERAGRDLRDFVLSICPPSGADQSVHFDWQDRADLR